MSSLKAGDYFIVDYGGTHQYEKSQGLTLINCLFLPEVIDDTLRGCQSMDALLKRGMIRYYRMAPGCSQADQMFHDTDGRIFRLISGMVKEYQEKRLGCNEIFRCRLREILILTLRRVVREESKPGQSSAVLSLISYVDENYSNPLTLMEFCGSQHYSVPYISRRFKQETGMTFREYLRKVRIEKSCELLGGAGMQVSEIAAAVGYRDVRSFNEAFKELVQLTPGEYRRISGRTV